MSSRRAIAPTKRFARMVSLVFALASWILADRAVAQGPTVDTSVPTLPGSGGSLLGPAPGCGRRLVPQLAGHRRNSGRPAGRLDPQGHSHDDLDARDWGRAGGHANADFVAPARTGFADVDSVLRDAGNSPPKTTTARPTE